MTWLATRTRPDFADYEELQRWSVDDLEGFWGAVGVLRVRAARPYERVLARPTMPGAQWFTGARSTTPSTWSAATRTATGSRCSPARRRAPPMRADLRRAARAGRRGRAPACSAWRRAGRPRRRLPAEHPGDAGRVHRDGQPRRDLGRLRARVRRPQRDRPLRPDRAEGAAGGRRLRLPRPLHRPPRRGRGDPRRAADAGARRRACPTATATLPDARQLGASCSPRTAPLEFEPVPFDHPLYVLFSSGTTGLPKAIVHGHGGQLLEHHKNQGLSWDLKPGGRLLWFSTTAWMMWNALVSALLLRASIVMLDGDPAWPDLLAAVAAGRGAAARPSMGVSPPYLMACRKAGLLPGRELRPRARSAMLCTRRLAAAGRGLPLGLRAARPRRAADQRLGRHRHVHRARRRAASPSRSTRARSPGPAWASTRTAFDADGNEVVGELGELVITSPMPSMPVALWGDADGSRYRASYFDRYPGVWRQGDWIMFTERGSCVLTGRSDATLNRGGVRLGTGEFYAVVEELPEVADALVVHLEDDERRQRRAAAVRRRRPTASSSTTRCSARIAARAARASSRRATCPTGSSPCRRSRAR